MTRTENVDDIDTDAATAQSSRVVEQVVAIEGESLRPHTRSRTEQAKQRQHDRRLARSRFAYQTESLPSMNVERNIVDGTNFPSRSASEDRFPLRTGKRERRPRQQRAPGQYRTADQSSACQIPRHPGVTTRADGF